MNIHMQVFVYIFVFIYSGYIVRSGTTGSYSTTMFNFLRNCQTIIQSNFSFLYSHQKYEDSNFPTSLSTFVIVYLSIITILVRDLTVIIIIVILICIFLMKLSIFCTFGHLYIFLKDLSIKAFAHFYLDCLFSIRL